ncbi:MAG: type 1 glutamine amidotransferase [Candidatus Kaiserbacteria bacterium]|nr:type 1 glutamine amidotransferase [Candidatus Kaiserbacteria bacterium]
MKKILVIQSRARPEMIAAEQEEYRHSVGDRGECTFLSALDESLLWMEPAKLLEGFDAIIIGGSGEFDLHGGRPDDDAARQTARKILERVKGLADYAIDHEKPLLGVCFGHQLLAEMRGGNVTNDHEQKKVGTFEVQLTAEGKNDPLMQSLPGSFQAQYGHKDSVTSLPQGAILLAVGPACKFSALKFGPKAYTMQFHPELRAQDVAWKLANSPGYLPEGVSAESIVKESTEASKIISLFIEKIAA